MSDLHGTSSTGPIAIFLSSLSGGGAERAMVNLANRFVECGVEVHLVLGRREGPYLSMIDPRVRIFDLGVTRMLKSLTPLNAYVKAERPTVLMPALAHTHVVALVGKILFRWPTRVILTVQNTPSASANVSSQRMERHWPMFVRMLYSKADDVIAISRGVADDLRQLTGGRVAAHIVNNPVVTPQFFQQLSEEIDHPWLKDNSVPVLLAAGRLTNQKDYPTMLNALALLHQRRPIRLIILGDGELRTELFQLCEELGIRDQVDFIGFTSNPYAWMKAADLFVLSSRWEGLANVIAEALACGTPVVSTNCPHGPAEILEEGKFGVLTPLSNPQELAAGIEAALEKNWDKAALRERGNDFGVNAIADSYLKILLPGATQ